MRRKKAFVITVLLLIMVLIAAGCSRSSNPTPVATAPEDTAAQSGASEQTTPPAATQDPAASAGAQNTEQPQQTTPGDEKKPPSTQPTTAPAASLVLGKGQNTQNGEITDVSTTFKAGEKFYYRFDNGGPFGVDKLSLQYADPASGTVINQYGIYVDSTSRYDSATMSFKTPGAYKIIIQVNGVERASKVVIIE